MKNEAREFGDTFSEKEKEVSGHAGGRKWFKYSPEFKRASVDRIVAGESPTAVARELGIHCKSLYAWKAKGKGSQGVAAPTQEVENDPQQCEITQLRKKISELERLAGNRSSELDFFAAALRSVRERPEERRGFRRGVYRVIQRHSAAQGEASIERMCELGKVSRAGFYRDWQEHQPQEAEVAIRDAIQTAAVKHRHSGYRRITRIVQREGIAVGEGVVRRILRSDNLLAIRQRKFKAKTNSDHGFTVYPNFAHACAASSNR